MIHRFLTIFMLVLTYSAIGQYGVRIKMNRNNYADWTNIAAPHVSSNQKMFRYGPEVGVDYWFRLKKHRVEFLPELTYGMSSTKYTQADRFTEVGLMKFGLNFHTQIYALDLEGDCNCPTFSKQGPSINKGLFFHLTPGIEHHTYSMKLPLIASSTAASASGLIGKIGIGLGLDLGVSDLVTITPQVTYNYHITGLDWNTSLVFPGSNPSQIQFSVRLGLRNDYAKKGRRR